MWWGLEPSSAFEISSSCWIVGINLTPSGLQSQAALLIPFPPGASGTRPHSDLWWGSEMAMNPTTTQAEMTVVGEDEREPPCDGWWPRAAGRTGPELHRLVIVAAEAPWVL